MKVYRLHPTQDLPIDLETAWSFFSDPRNLSEITPPELRLTVLTEQLPERMHEGMIIRYTLHPWLRVRIGWVTEITHVDEPHTFVDEQRFGPYRFWHHLHRFSPTESGVEVEDTVHYATPMGILGRPFHGLLVKRSLDRIFDYRKKVLADRFGIVRSQQETE